MELAEKLWAVHEIRQLAYRYAYACDSGDATMLESLFVETNEPAGDLYVDIHAIRARIGPKLTLHAREQMFFVCNHLVDFDDDENAHGTVYGAAQIQFSAQFIDQSIMYQDIYQVFDGNWRFVHRRHLLWFGAARPVNPLQQPDANWPISNIGYGVVAKEIRKRSR